MSRIGKIARRGFLLGSVAVAGGVAFGYWKFRQPYPNPLKDDLAEGEAALTPYVKIAADGITLYSPRSEMGQGVMTTLAALIAEELDVSLDQVTVEHAPAGFVYYNTAAMEEALPVAGHDEGRMAEFLRAAVAAPAKFIGQQMTGGSSSTPDAFEKLRRAGAAARMALVQAAAKKLGVAADRLRTEAGAVIAPDGRRVAYTELAALAAEIEPLQAPPLKPRAEWRLLGRSQDRVDMVAKSTGTATFGIDVRLPGMLFATLRRNPRWGGELRSFDAEAARAMPGVRKIVPLPGGVAVAATNSWIAFRAAEAIECDWGETQAPETTEGHWAAIAAAFDEAPDSRNRDDGDVEAALGPDTPTREYRAPYLAHATMEPMNCTALVEDHRAEIWVGTQNPTASRAVVAEATGLPIDAIRVHTTYLGGGFGRRGETDMVRDATLIALAMKGTPVQLILSREEDTRHDFYRPMAMARIRGRVSGGRIEALDMAVSSLANGAQLAGRLGIPFAGPDPSIVQGAWDQPYAPPHFRVSGHRAPDVMPVGVWRSVGASQNAFFLESAIDELAHEAGIDPVELRLNTLAHAPSRKVVEAVADMAGWGGELAPGRARGVAFSYSFGVPAAEVVEIEAGEDGIRVAKVWAAVDVGTALDPRNVEAQVMSGVVYGLSAAMFNEITLADGAVEQSNFDDYEVMRLHQAPEIEVRALENGDRIRGIGEPGTPPAAPALANAIFAATGRRLRETPFAKSVDFA